MVKFVCINCGYRFESEKGKRCPYCGGEDVEEEKSAEELVEKVMVE